MNAFAHRVLSNALAAGLLLAVLVLRGAMPAGFMPSMLADGSPTWELCSSAGAVPLPWTPGGSDPGQPAKHTGNSDAPCVFAAAVGAAPPPALLAIAVALARQIDQRQAASSPQFPYLLQRAHGARAPPQIS